MQRTMTMGLGTYKRATKEKENKRREARGMLHWRCNFSQSIINTSEVLLTSKECVKVTEAPPLWRLTLDISVSTLTTSSQGARDNVGHGVA